MENKPIKRDIADEIVKYIDTDNIIVLHGERQVGKTCILYYLENLLKSRDKATFFFDLEDSRLVNTLDAGVDSFLAYLRNEGFDLDKIKNGNGRLYVFIDEVQYLDNPSPLLKLLADHHKYIQLIVSGSSSFNIKSKFSDSLAGRTVDFEIFNLSFREFIRFKGLLYELENISSGVHLDKAIELYHEYVFFGGYPKIVLENSVEKKEKYLQQIIDTYVKKDIRDLAHVKDTRKFNNLLKVLASQSGQLLNVAQLANTCSLAKQTIESYLFILENTYVLRLVTPFSSSSKVEVVKTPKIFFYDTGLLEMLWLGGLQKNLIGNIFETSVFSELVKKYGAQNIHYWRNRNQNEIDFILELKGKILPIEAKVSFRSFRKLSMSSFCRRYSTDEYKVAGLIGQKENKNYIYPWEI
ncbi:MAG: ATP-binding protein [Candidatus Omnitrophota bacterium]